MVDRSAGTARRDRRGRTRRPVDLGCRRPRAPAGPAPHDGRGVGGVGHASRRGRGGAPRQRHAHRGHRRRRLHGRRPGDVLAVQDRSRLLQRRGAHPLRPRARQLAAPHRRGGERDVPARRGGAHPGRWRLGAARRGQGQLGGRATGPRRHRRVRPDVPRTPRGRHRDHPASTRRHPRLRHHAADDRLRRPQRVHHPLRGTRPSGAVAARDDVRERVARPHQRTRRAAGEAHRRRGDVQRGRALPQPQR